MLRCAVVCTFGCRCGTTCSTNFAWPNFTPRRGTGQPSLYQFVPETSVALARCHILLGCCSYRCQTCSRPGQCNSRRTTLLRYVLGVATAQSANIEHCCKLSWPLQEHAAREAIFASNIDLIKQHNFEDHSYKVCNLICCLIFDWTKG